MEQRVLARLQTRPHGRERAGAKTMRIGKFVDGEWRVETPQISGGFVRADTVLRNWITPDGAPGPTGVGGFRAEPGRYHLYVSLACPWAHRTISSASSRVLKT